MPLLLLVAVLAVVALDVLSLANAPWLPIAALTL